MMPDVLLVCLSQKPGFCDSEKRSATRQLLRICADSLQDRKVSYDYVDLRDTPFPFFDGREPQQCGSTVEAVANKISQSSYIIFSVPAYWRSMSGVAKNFFDVLSGTAYDQAEPSHFLKGKNIGVIIVGGTDGDSAAALPQFDTLVRMLGANGLRAVVHLDNPRHHQDMKSVVKECFQLPFTIAQATATNRVFRVKDLQ